MSTNLFISYTDQKRTGLTTGSFTALTSSTVTITDSPTEEGTWYVFEPDLTDEEIIAISSFLEHNDNYDALISLANAAMTNNRSWLTNALPQLVTGANQIINSTTASSLPNDKNLATAVKTVSNQLADVLKQNNAIIRLLMNDQSGTD